MNTRKLPIALATAGIATAGFGAAVLPARARRRPACGHGHRPSPSTCRRGTPVDAFPDGAPSRRSPRPRARAAPRRRRSQRPRRRQAPEQPVRAPAARRRRRPVAGARAGPPSPEPPGPAARQKTTGKRAARPREADDASPARDDEAPQARSATATPRGTRLREPDGAPTLDQPRPLDRHARRRADRRPELLHRQVPHPAVPALDLPGRRHRVRHPLGGPRGDQRDRDRLRPQPQRLLRGRPGLDAVHARDVEAVRRRRQRRQEEGPVQPGRRDLRRRALPQGRRRRGGPAPRDLRLQPRRLVRRLGPHARAPDRRPARRTSSARSPA